MRGLRHPRAWIAILSAAAVLWFAAGYVRRTSPGPLATVHAREAKLTGFNSCAGCHGGVFGDMTGACLECHAAIGEDVKGARGIHGALGERRSQQCALCHSEHHGPEFQPTNRQSFLQAGVRDPATFDHGTVGYAMGGRHLEIACADCHANAEAAPLEAGASRYRGLSRECASCHEDPHEGRMAVGCADCHGESDWTLAFSRGHGKRLPLVGGHGDQECRVCHAKDSAHALEARPPKQRGCLDCHESPHREGFAGERCDLCHLASHGSFREETIAVTPDEHARSGFPLEGPHAEVSCADCHDPARAGFLLRYPGREPDRCDACHEDPHRGQFRPDACLSCHDRDRFLPHSFTDSAHAGTRLALEGRHARIGCNECHVRPEGAARAFRKTDPSCAACHEDAHGGFFDRRAKGKRASCGACHRPTGFADLRPEGFDHARDAGFPLRGAHAEERCEACHPRAEEPDGARRTFGRVSERFGEFRGCATCHEDPHGGLFDRPPAPPRIPEGDRCAACHVETSFRAVKPGFDHGAATGYALEGGHAEIGCAACHEPLRKPLANRRTTARARGRRCAECHEDPHAGQFEEEGATDCERCHPSAAGFERLSFRHDRDSSFPLDRAHEALECGACHKPVAGVVRWKPLGRRCSDCHGDQEDPLLRKKGR